MCYFTCNHGLTHSELSLNAPGELLADKRKHTRSWTSTVTAWLSLKINY